jgi:hypothetical protein
MNLLGRAVDLLPAGDQERLRHCWTWATPWPRRGRGAGRARSSPRRSTAPGRRGTSAWPPGAPSPCSTCARRPAPGAGPTRSNGRRPGRSRCSSRPATAGLASSWRLIADVCNRRQQWAELERVGRRILGDARQAGDRRTEARILAGISASLCLGPTPAAEAAERCQRILAELGGAPRPTMMVLDSLALCSAMLRRFDQAGQLLARADAIREELAGKLWKVGRVEFGAWTYLLAAGTGPSGSSGPPTRRSSGSGRRAARCRSTRPCWPR